MDGLCCSRHVLPVRCDVHTKRRARKVDLTNQFHATVKHHHLWPVMEFCPPGSKGHDHAVVARAGTARRPLVRTCAANGIGPKHTAAWDIEQVDLATEPAVGVVASERAHSRTVMRDGGSFAKPKIRSGEMDYLDIGGPIECIHVEIEAARYEHAAVARDWVENGSGARACDAEYNVAVAGVDESGFIVLRHEGHRAVIGQSHAVHSKWIRPR